MVNIKPIIGWALSGYLSLLYLSEKSMNLEAEAFILQHLSIYHQHSKENLRPISRFEETFARDCVVFFAERARLPNNNDDLLRVPKLTGPFDVKRSEKIQRLYIRLNEPKAAGFLEFLKINIRPSSVDFVTGIQLTEKFEFQQSSGKFDVRTLESPKVLLDEARDILLNDADPNLKLKGLPFRPHKVVVEKDVVLVYIDGFHGIVISPFYDGVGKAPNFCYTLKSNVPGFLHFLDVRP